MMKIIAGLLVVLATIFGQIVSYHVVVAVAPAYMSMWIAAVVLTWVGLVLNAVSD